MWSTTDGSSGRLVQLCLAYFSFYVVTGVCVKYFLGSAAAGYPGMSDMSYLLYSTLGGTLVCLAVVLAGRWYRMQSVRPITVGARSVPSELLYIIPSGICTAVVIPTTTLMYTLPVSVMVAMVIMRASVIIIGRVVDAIQIRQGILRKKVYAEENAAVVVAVIAASINIFGSHSGGFDFLKSSAAIVIFSSYITAYAIRIYIMNYFKNTRPKGAALDNRGFFAIEQIAAAIALALAGMGVFFAPTLFGLPGVPQIEAFRGAILAPDPAWGWATLSGVAYGMVAFFSVFIFMFKGRTATFAGLVNRLTSLVAGTTATLVSAAFFGTRFPQKSDWIALLFVFLAVAFLTLSERKRAREVAVTVAS